MSKLIDNVKIRGIVSAVPSYVEEKDRYVEILGEKRVKKQTRLTGVKKRHINDMNQTTADMAIDAAKKLLDELKWNREDIRVLVFVTQNPSMRMPSTAFIIHKELSLSKDCVAFDINLGCSGYVTGIHVVGTLLNSCGKGAKALLLVGDAQRNKEFSQPETEDEIADQMLFGSAAAATALELCDCAEKIYFDEKSYGEEYLAISQRHNECSVMDGEAVFEFAINEVVNNVMEFRKSICSEKIDYYVFHQAQRFILSTVAELCGIIEEKMLYSLEEYGNTSSASIPLTICHNRKLLVDNDTTTFLLCGFGIGLACATMSIVLGSDCYLDVIETDSIYPF